jgi:TPR repeat protein
MRSIEGLRDDVRAQRAVPPAPPPTPPASVVVAPPPPPYLGETPEVAALRVAAHGGDAAAAHDLAVALREGKRVAPDREEALRWFERAADRGDPRAMRTLAGLKTNSAQRIFWYRRAVEIDYDPETALLLIKALERNAEALTWTERLAREKTDPDLMLQAHVLAVRHRGSDQAAEAGWVERALATLRERVARGDSGAARALVALLETGQYKLIEDGHLRTYDVTSARPGDALALLEQLAASGQAWALERLERVFREGSALGVERDEGRAREWLLKQVELGLPDAVQRYTETLVAPAEQPEVAELLRRTLAQAELPSNWREHFATRLVDLLKSRPDLRKAGDP